jgi:hypothetical protein
MIIIKCKSSMYDLNKKIKQVTFMLQEQYFSPADGRYSVISPPSRPIKSWEIRSTQHLTLIGQEKNNGNLLHKKGTC